MTTREFDYLLWEGYRVSEVANESTSAGAPPVPEPIGARPLKPEEFRRWYGGWEPLDPTNIAAFMDGFDRPWWIIGGWSIEAFTGVERIHEDMDISILSGDAEAFRLFLGDRWTPWNVDDSWFRPFDSRFADVRPDSQVWVRRDARSPWILDVPFTPDAGGRWTNKRHLAHTEDLNDVTWVGADGLRYAARGEPDVQGRAAQGERPSGCRGCAATARCAGAKMVEQHDRSDGSRSPLGQRDLTTTTFICFGSQARAERVAKMRCRLTEGVTTLPAHPDHAEGRVRFQLTRESACGDERCVSPPWSTSADCLGKTFGIRC